MHRLPEFSHNIICNIDKVVDGTDSLRRQTSLHPFRRWRNGNVFDHSGNVAGTQIAVFYGYFNKIVCILFISRFCNNRRVKFLSERCSGFSCDSERRITVYPVGCDFIFDYGVMKPKNFHRIRSHRNVRMKNIDSKLRRLRIHIAAGTKFFDRTHHAVGFYAPELSLFDLNSTRRQISVVSAGNASTA